MSAAHHQPTRCPTNTTRHDCFTHLRLDSVGALFLESHLGGLDNGPHQLGRVPAEPTHAKLARGGVGAVHRLRALAGHMTWRGRRIDRG